MTTCCCCSTVAKDAAGICTASGWAFGMPTAAWCRDVFRTRNMRSLPGNTGIGHVRYPAGSAANSEEAQPFYVNAPFGIVLAHNGNLTNSEQLKDEMFRRDLRHINTDSDSEVLLNVLAHELHESAHGDELDPDVIFKAVSGLHRRARGAYACVAEIAGWACWRSAVPTASARCASAWPRPTRAPSTWWRRNPWRSRAWAFAWCATCSRARPSSSTATATSTRVEVRAEPGAQPLRVRVRVLRAPGFKLIDGASVYATRLRMGEYKPKIARELPLGEILDDDAHSVPRARRRCASTSSASTTARAS